MRFNTPIGYSTICKGALVYSIEGIIDTEDKALIEQLTKSAIVKPEEKPSQKLIRPEKGA